MSLLSRNQLRIALSPDRAWVVRLRGGMRPDVLSRHAVPCDAARPDEMPWARALESLERGLRTLEGATADATVVLSNHFVRYALLPWSDQISDQNEEQAFIRHCFTQTYGEGAQRWALRTSPNGYGQTRVASAIDQELVDGLERVATAHSLRVISLQPYFMTVFNQWRHQLLGSVVWFVVAEPGRLCVSQLQQGRWHSLRTVKVGDDWQHAMMRYLERELIVSDSGTERGAVYLFAPHLAVVPALQGWTVHRLGEAAEVTTSAETYFS